MTPAAERVRALLAETMPCRHTVRVEWDGPSVQWECFHETCEAAVYKALAIGARVTACFAHWSEGDPDPDCVDCEAAAAGNRWEVTR